MKKIRSILLVLALTLSMVLLAGCNTSDDNYDMADSSVAESVVSSSEAESSEEEYSYAESEASSILSDVGAESAIDDLEDDSDEESAEYIEYTFRNDYLLNQHYEKHGIEMGFDSPEEYEAAACAVANDPDALHKEEAEDGDDVYYLEDTNEFVIVSGDGYLRTYFYPSAGKAYYDRQ